MSHIWDTMQELIEYKNSRAASNFTDSSAPRGAIRKGERLSRHDGNLTRLASRLNGGSNSALGTNRGRLRVLLLSSVFPSPPPFSFFFFPCFLRGDFVRLTKTAARPAVPHSCNVGKRETRKKKSP